jgi:hypothetical protein
MAERVGFEPTVPLQVHTLSKRAPSTTRPSLRVQAQAPGNAGEVLPHRAITPLRVELGLAEREGFEPSIGINLYTLSRGAPSATRPPLRGRQRIPTHAAPSPPPAPKEPDSVPISGDFRPLEAARRRSPGALFESRVARRPSRAPGTTCRAPRRSRRRPAPDPRRLRRRSVAGPRRRPPPR